MPRQRPKRAPAAPPRAQPAHLTTQKKRPAGTRGPRKQRPNQSPLSPSLSLPRPAPGHDVLRHELPLRPGAREAEVADLEVAVCVQQQVGGLR